MRICFYFVLFFTAKCLNFYCQECCEDCCCDWWNNLWEDCYKERNKEEEEDFLDDYKKKAQQNDLRYREEIKKQKKAIKEQKEKLKNKIRRYLNHIKNNVENINNKFGQENSTKEELFNQISKINELMENFKQDEYFNTNSIEKIQGDLGDLQDLCRKAGIISLDVFYKENEKWKKFLEKNGIHEKYEEEKNITEDIFSLNNTLEKLKNNFGTYLLEIFKTRLFPTDKNEDKYKNEFMKFYSDYPIDVFKNTLIIEDSLLNFYRQILQKVKPNKLNDTNEKQAFEIYKEKLLQEQHRYLGYALLTDGNDAKIIEKIYEQIECKIFSDAKRLKEKIIPPLIGSFKDNIVEIIKDFFQEQLNVNKNFQKNKSEEIKKIASRKYNEAIKDLYGEKIELTFHNSYDIPMETTSFLKDCKLSVLFDYILSKGRKFYASDEEKNIVDEELGYINYNNEKDRLDLKTRTNFGYSLNEAIKNNENITIGEFYEKNIHQVVIFFKSDN